MTDTDVQTTPLQNRRRSLRYRIVRGVISVVFIYCAVVFGLYLLQDFLVFPGQQSQGKAWAQVRLRPGDDRRMVEVQTATGQLIRGIFGPARGVEVEVAPTILFFYGNGDCLALVWPTVEGWRSRGFNVLVGDYPGYGISGGKPSEPNLYAMADAVYDWVTTQAGIDGRRLIVFGWSLGGAVAIDLASRRPVGGLATISTFSSLTDMATRLYPILPSGLVLRHRFENLRKISTIDVPTLIMHGRDDPLTPWQMSKKLAEAAGGDVRTHWIDSGGHNDVFEAGGDVVDAALLDLASRIERRIAGTQPASAQLQ